MASPSVTYSFTNGTSADATQVNQNFTDLINGITDGSKDLNISALTCAGNVTMNGNGQFGNAASDTFTFTGQLKASGQVYGNSTSKSANYTITDSDGVSLILMTTSTTNRTVTLPSASTNSGRIITVKKVDSTNLIYCRIDGAGAETIDGLTAIDLFLQYSYLKVQSTGTGWIILDYKQESRWTDFGVTDNGATSWTTRHARGLVKVTESGQFLMTFSIEGTTSNATSISVSLTGIGFSQISSGNYLPVAGFAGSGSTGFNSFVADQGTNDIRGWVTANSSIWTMGGTLQITGQPAWAP